MTASLWGLERARFVSLGILYYCLMQLSSARGNSFLHQQLLLPSSSFFPLQNYSAELN